MGRVTAHNRSTGGSGRCAASANTALRAASPVAQTLCEIRGSCIAPTSDIGQGAAVHEGLK